MSDAMAALREAEQVRELLHQVRRGLRIREALIAHLARSLAVERAANRELAGQVAAARRETQRLRADMCAYMEGALR